MALTEIDHMAIKRLEERALMTLRAGRRRGYVWLSIPEGLLLTEERQWIADRYLRVIDFQGKFIENILEYDDPTKREAASPAELELADPFPHPEDMKHIDDDLPF